MYEFIENTRHKASLHAEPALDTFLQNLMKMLYARIILQIKILERKKKNIQKPLK